ncbi:hypothetical protein [Mitsuokella sp. WILCCON 0060]
MQERSDCPQGWAAQRTFFVQDVGTPWQTAKQQKRCSRILRPI